VASLLQCFNTYFCLLFSSVVLVYVWQIKGKNSSKINNSPTDFKVHYRDILTKKVVEIIALKHRFGPN
jgi:hypothetical protein